jgi:aspartyl-tRNA(Asn)/glutamyl-tRNA(Gln) amidotransferase subunit A
LWILPRQAQIKLEINQFINMNSINSILSKISNRPTVSEIHQIYREMLSNSGNGQKNASQEVVLEVTKYFLERSENLDKSLNSMLYFTKDRAIQTASKLDQILTKALTENPQSSNSNQIFDEILKKYPLFGIPFATKSIIQVEGETFSASSQIMDGFKSPFSATVMEKLENAGAILIGVTNMDQWAMGSSNETSDFGFVRNPFDTDRIPGGSSGGSASAVGGGLVVFSLGTDTGGSIRQPAGFCDVVGLKPTYGLVSRWGIMPMANSFDQAGPITNNISDNRLVLGIIAGKDVRDQTTI